MKIEHQKRKQAETNPNEKKRKSNRNMLFRCCSFVRQSPKGLKAFRGNARIRRSDNKNYQANE